MNCHARSHPTPDLDLATVQTSLALRPNRRREIRRAARLACRVSLRSDGRALGDCAVDVSPRGLLVLSDERVDPTERLLVSFQTTDLPIWFDTEATVARVVEGRRTGDRGRALGLRFESLSAVSRLILRGNLKRHPPTEAARELPPGLAPPSFDYAAEILRILES